MDKKLTTQYNEYLNNTAPDMDMLWSRIESRLDSADNAAETTNTVDISDITAARNKSNEENTHEENNKKIKVSSFNTKKFAAVAAAFIVVVAGVTLMKNNMGVKTDTQNTADFNDIPSIGFSDDGDDGKSAKKPHLYEKNDKNDDVTAEFAFADDGDDNEDAEAVVEGDDGLFIGDTDDYRSAETNGAKKSGEAATNEADDGDDEEPKTTEALNDNAANTAPSDFDGETADEKASIFIDENTEISSEEYIQLTTPEIEYDQLKLTETDTKAYEESYEPINEHFMGEKEILEETEYFADVTVKSAALGENEAEYTLTVNEIYPDDFVEKVRPEEITLKSSSPFILQESREYFAALKRVDDEWQLVYDNAPQIQITIDGGFIFSTEWYHLYVNVGANRFYDPNYMQQEDRSYSMLLYCKEPDIDNLFKFWGIERLDMNNVRLDDTEEVSSQ